MMQRIFNDENEPFWRSAKQVELGVIARAPFAAYIKHQFERTDRYIAAEAVDAILDSTGGHPYATQELCYFAWQETAADERAEAEHVDAALTKVLRSEHAHFSLLWERASSVQRVLLDRARPRAGAPADRRLPAPPQPAGALDGAAGGRGARARRAGRARPRQRPDRRAVPRGVAGA